MMRPSIKYLLIAGFFLITAIAVAWHVFKDDPKARDAKITDQTPHTESSLHGALSQDPVDDGEERHARAESHDPTSMPAVELPDGTPWREVYAALSTSAQNGNRAAADRLFRDTMRCRRYLAALRAAPNALNSSDIAIKQNVSKDAVTDLYKDLGTLSALIESSAPACEGVNSEELADLAYPILLQAAMLGNEAAATCYVAAVFDPGDGSSVQRENYRKHAFHIARTGIEQGNWDMVAVMQVAYADAAPKSSWYGNLVEPDPVKLYEYTLLSRLGASGDAVAKIDQDLHSMAAHYGFDDDTIAAAESWAQSVYRTSFEAQPWTDRPQICDVH